MKKIIKGGYVHKDEIDAFNILTEIYNSIDKTRLKSNVNFSLHIKTDADTDTEIFIRKGIKIYSFRVHKNGFYQRWGEGGKWNTKEDVIKEIERLIY